MEDMFPPLYFHIDSRLYGANNATSEVEREIELKAADDIRSRILTDPVKKAQWDKFVKDYPHSTTVIAFYKNGIYPEKVNS